MLSQISFWDWKLLLFALLCGAWTLTHSCTKHTDSDIYSLHGNQVYITNSFFKFSDARTLSGYLIFPLNCTRTLWCFKMPQTLFLHFSLLEEGAEKCMKSSKRCLYSYSNWIQIQAQHFHQLHKSEQVEGRDQFTAQLTTSPSGMFQVVKLKVI